MMISEYSKAADALYAALNAGGREGFLSCAGSCAFTPCVCSPAYRAVELLRSVDMTSRSEVTR